MIDIGLATCLLGRYKGVYPRAVRFASWHLGCFGALILEMPKSRTLTKSNSPCRRGRYSPA